MKFPAAFVYAPALVVAAPEALAEAPATYLTIEQAQALLFPRQEMRRVNISLTKEQVRKIEKAAGGKVVLKSPPIWRASAGGWFLVDDVIGRYDRITYALAIDPSGLVKGVEVLVYRELHGGEIRNPKWRAQFNGLAATQPPEFESNIANITGATLSCRHVTSGIRRLLELHARVLQNLPD
jgi:Na+-translocating ferredoxin:NAD+ oxidoreductase RnfG subunit